ncbi:hypothetical protein [Sorangium sp. So ce1153]|uniref:hypothetical protein n=1 Tax=Sorangium sp. So ce1153 TaxID=3133333 RepID=UPI003F5FF3B1
MRRVFVAGAAAAALAVWAGSLFGQAGEPSGAPKSEGASPVAPQRAEGPLIESARGTTQVLRSDAKLRIPLVLQSGVAPDAIWPQVASVTTFGADDPGLLSAFVPKIAVEQGAGPVLTLEVVRALRPATYDVAVELLVRQAQAAPAREILVVRVLADVGALRPIGPLVFEQDLSVFRSDEPLRPSSVSLRETTGKTALGPIEAEQVGAATSGDQPIVARLVVTPPANIDPDASQQATFTSEGSFPAGTSRGKIEIRSPQLREAMVVDYELRARYHHVWILPVFWGAGLLGWLYRVVLRQREERHRLEVQAGGVVGRLRAELKRNTSDDQVTLREGLDALEHALRDGDVAAVRAAIESADARLAKAAAARVQRRTEHLTAIAARQADVDVAWSLPSGVDLSAAKLALSTARSAFLADDMAGGEAGLGEVQGALAALPKKAMAWIERIRVAVTRFDPGQGPVPHTIRLERKEDIARLRAALDAAAVCCADPRAATKDLLAAVHAAHTIAEEVVGRARARVAEVAGALAKAIDDDDARKQVQEAAARLPGDRSDTAGALEVLTGVFDDIHEAVGTVIKQQGGGATSDDAETAWKEGRYLDAVTAPDSSKGVAGMGGTNVSDDGGGAALEPMTVAVAAPVVVAGAQTFALTPPVSVPLDVLFVKSARQLVRDRLWIGLITAGLSGVFAWLLYKDSWFGSPKDWIGVAVVAFTSDFTIEALLESSTRVKKP